MGSGRISNVHGIPAGLRLRRPGYRERHKLEVFRVGSMNAFQIDRVVRSVFDVDAFELPVSRVDFTADVRGIPVDWFRSHAYVLRKRNGQEYKTHRDVTGTTETIYFGSRKDLIRVYDKTAELRVHEQTADWRLDTWTRVERQLRSDRLARLAPTFGDLVATAESLNPFAGVHFEPGAPTPPIGSWPAVKYFTGLGLHYAVERDGLQTVRQLLNRNGNAHRTLETYSDFIGVGDPFTPPDLDGIFRRSVMEQLWPTDYPAEGEGDLTGVLTVFTPCHSDGHLTGAPSGGWLHSA